MQETKYLSSIIMGLFTMAENNPDCTFTELIYSFTRGKHLLDFTDEEVYNLQAKVVDTKLKEENPATEEEFNNWINSK